jgi:hypothetical protein
MVKGRRGPLGHGNGKPLPAWVMAWHKARDLLALQRVDRIESAYKKAEDERRRRRVLPNDQPPEELDKSAASVLTGENS